MAIWEVVLATIAGFAAGIINTAVGSGSLVTYPVLVLVGLPPVTANITNTVGLVPGSFAGAWAFRHELRQQRDVALRLLPVAAAGAVGGAALLLVLPGRTFQFVVPVLILISVLLVAFQPLIARRLGTGRGRTLWVGLSFAVFGTSIYGGYFGAAQGVILLGVLGIFLDATLQHQTALKNLLQATVNVVAAVFFIVSGGVDWLFAACVAVGALAGAPLGARLVRRLPARVFRIAIVGFGLVVAAIMTYQLVTTR
jgi:uncharacterized membrane protein YfcA